MWCGLVILKTEKLLATASLLKCFSNQDEASENPSQHNDIGGEKDESSHLLVGEKVCFHTFREREEITDHDSDSEDKQDDTD